MMSKLRIISITYHILNRINVVMFLSSESPYKTCQIRIINMAIYFVQNRNFWNVFCLRYNIADKLTSNYFLIYILEVKKGFRKVGILVGTDKSLITWTNWQQQTFFSFCLTIFLWITRLRFMANVAFIWPNMLAAFFPFNIRLSGCTFIQEPHALK